MDKNREDLLQNLVQRMMSVMRHVRHQGLPGDPVLSPPHLHVLFSISRKREGISVKELAEGANVTPGAITQFVDSLVEKGLVTREQDPVDRRSVRLTLTDLAKSQFERFRQGHLASMCRVFEVLSDDEIKQLTALITKIDTHHDLKEKINAEPDKTP